MSPLLVPIFAQVVTLGISDRTEVRHIVAQDPAAVGINRAGNSFSEVATSPRVGLGLAWRKATLSVGYGPSLTLTPLEAKEPDLLVYHFGSVAASYRWQHTVLTVSESVGYGEVNFQVQALADPRNTPAISPPPGGTPSGAIPTPPAPGGTLGGNTPPPSTGAPAQPNAANPNLATGTVRIGSTTTAVNVAHFISPRLALSGGVSYSVSGSVGGDEATPVKAPADPSVKAPIYPSVKNTYPTVKGPGAVLSLRYSPTRSDALTTSLSSQFASISGGGADGNQSWFLVATETWSHKLGKRTASSLGTGLSLSRNSQPNGLVSYSVYPNFSAGITHAASLARGDLTVGANISSAPYIDPLRALVDPSLNAGAFIGFTKDRFGSSLTANTGLVLVAHDENDKSALKSMGSAFMASYRLADGISVDSGIRAAWQSLGQITTIPPSIAVFAGITLGTVVHLKGH